LICHQEGYLGLHARIAKVSPFFDVEHFDQAAGAALLYLCSDHVIQDDKMRALAAICAPTCRKISREFHQSLRACVESRPEYLGLYDGHR